MSVEELIEQLADAPDARDRRIAAEDLAAPEYTSEAVIDALISGLSDQDKGVRDACANALTRDPHSMTEYKAGGIQRGVASLIGDPDIEIRNLAGDVLFRLGQAAAPGLAEWLNDTADNIKFACDLMGAMNYGGPVDAITELLAHEDANVRGSAIETLGKLQHDGAMDGLLELYDQDEALRPHIIDAVGSIGGPRAESFLLGTIASDDEFLQVASIDALAGGATGVAVAHRLMELLPEAAAPIQGILLTSIYSIALRFDENIELPITLRAAAYAALADSDADVRVAGLLGLGSEYVAADIPSLLTELNRRESETRRQILMVALGYSSLATVETFIAELLRYFADDGVTLLEILSDAGEVFIQMDDERRRVFLDTLFNQLDTAPQVRTEIIELVCSLAPQRAVAVLRRELHSDDQERRDSARMLARQFNLGEVLTEEDTM